MHREKSRVNFSPVIGQSVTGINRTYPIIKLERGQITIECCWRLRRNQRIIVGQPETEIEDKKEETFLKLEGALIGNRLIDIIHYEDISDLTLEFDRGVFLDLFHDSSKYEGWQLEGPNELVVIAMPGGSYFYKEGK